MTSAGIFSTMSPNTPPRPDGSGQVSGGVMQPAIAAAQQRAAEPGDARGAHGRSMPRPLASRTAPDDGRHQRRDRRQAEELHGEVGEHRAGIAHRVGHRIVGGVAEARIGDVPGAEAASAKATPASSARPAARLACRRANARRPRSSSARGMRKPGTHASTP